MIYFLIPSSSHRGLREASALPSPVGPVSAVMYFMFYFLSKASISSAVGGAAYDLCSCHTWYFSNMDVLGKKWHLVEETKSSPFTGLDSESFLWSCYIILRAFYFCHLSCCYLKSPFKCKIQRVSLLKRPPKFCWVSVSVCNILMVILLA